MVIETLQELKDKAKKFIKQMRNDKVFAFYGEMGAGKTTFIKAICEELGVKDTMSSPTFSIVNEYMTPSGKVYHFDFYRIKNLNEAFDMGYESYLYSGELCFIEWPEKVEALLPPSHVKVYLQTEQEKRIIKISRKNDNF